MNDDSDDNHDHHHNDDDDGDDLLTFARFPEVLAVVTKQTVTKHGLSMGENTQSRYEILLSATPRRKGTVLNERCGMASRTTWNQIISGVV